MPRGVHANSLANLVRSGGDRTKGKKLVIEAIEKALKEIPNGREIRAFFGLRPAQLLKAKHRARWAKVKAPAVYDAMVETMAEEIALSGDRLKAKWIEEEIRAIKEYYKSEGLTSPLDLEDMQAEIDETVAEMQGLEIPTRYGVLNIDGFVDIRARVTAGLYPVRVYKSGEMVPVREDSLDHAWFYFMGAKAGFGQYPTQVKRAGLWELVWRWYPANGRGVNKVIARVKVEHGINIQMYLEKAGEVRNLEVDLAPAELLVYIEDHYSNYWVPYHQLSEYVPVTRFLVDWDDAIAVARSFSGEGWSYDIPLLQLAGAMGTAQFDAAMAAKLDGWNFEFESLGAGKGGTPERVAEFFPRRQVVSGELDPVKGEMVYSDVKWLGWEEWDEKFGANRGAWIAAGAIVPPAVCPAPRRELSVTFDSEFIAAVGE